MPKRRSQSRPICPGPALPCSNCNAPNGEWDAALKTLDRNLHSKLIDRKQGRRLRAVLLTGQAMTLESSEPDRARKLSLEAHGLAPDLVPASVLAGRVLARLGDIGKAAKVLESTWKKQAHPDVAEAYAHVRPGDSVRDRLKRMEKLSNLRPNNPAGAFAHARVAIDAGEWAVARDAMKRVMRSDPTREACLLMAELEEAENGDRGRVREWLSRAVTAPLDPAWTADGIVADEWAPVSPVSGRVDAFEWKVPVREPEDRRLLEVEETLLNALPPADPVPAEPEPPIVEDIVSEPAPVAASEAPAPETVEKAAVSEPVEEKAETSSEKQDGASDSDPSADTDKKEAASKSANGDGRDNAEDQPETEASDKADADKIPDQSDLVEFPLKRRPDDPGPKTDKPAEEAKQKRHGLFS